MHNTAKILIAAFLLGWPCHAGAADDSERGKVEEDMKNYGFKTVTTPDGLHFNVPEDMPIQKKDGIVAPLPFDEYLYYKFRKMEEKLSEMDKKLDALTDEVKKLAEAQKKKEKALASQNP